MSSALGNKKIEYNEQQMERTQDLGRGSKSLPVSPITSPISTPDNSPKSRRRLGQPNRFFTGAFISDRDKYPGGWILSGLLNQSREIVGHKIAEEDETPQIGPKRPLSRKKSISSQNLSYIIKDKMLTEETANIQPGNAIQAQPSELREMNFWSPTSM